MEQVVRFSKMHSLGNDFVVLDGITQFVPVHRRLFRQLSHRRFGMGCDQILLIEPPENPEFDFLYRIFNADGKEVEQCGNGARCVGRYLKDSGLFYGNHLKLQTQTRTVHVYLEQYPLITVDMGPPNLEPSQIPIVANRSYPHRYQIELFHENKVFHGLSLGNPHAVFFVPDVKAVPVEKIGRTMQKHPAFPKGVNVGFCRVMARNHVQLRVFERGCGETYACGSGACAAVISGILNQELSDTVGVDLPGGRLTVQWKGDGHPVLLSGPTQMVYNGEFLFSKTNHGN